MTCYQKKVEFSQIAAFNFSFAAISDISCQYYVDWQVLG